MRPPARCPCCGALPAKLEKRWDRHHLPTGRVLRYPVSVSAEYHCGARIEALYIVAGGLSGMLGSAFWQLVAAAGCVNAVKNTIRRANAPSLRRLGRP